ncbi:Ig-like domain-containing protein [Pantoea endophytica]
MIGIEDATGATIGDVTNNPNPVVVGTADPSEEGSVIEIRDQDGNVVGTGVVDEDGNWTAPISPALEEGDYELIAVIIDPAGNETEMEGDPIELEVDLTPPDAPEVIGIESMDGTSLIAPFAIAPVFTNNPAPVVVGTADRSEAGSRIEIRDESGRVLGTGVVEANGTWRAPISPALVDGNYILKAVLIDRAGNETPMRDSIDLTIDTAAPELPDDGSIGPGNAFEGAWDDVGDRVGWIADSTATDDARPEFKGQGLTANAGEFVVIYNGDTVLGTTIIGADGRWSWTPGSDLANGSYDVSIALRDKAGNLSDRTDSLQFDISAGGGMPAAPAISGMFNDNSGAEVAITNGLTNDNTPVVRGTGVNGTVVTLYNGDVAIGSAVVTGGVWAITPTAPLTDGNHVLTAKATNAVGNTGAASTPVNLVVDTVAPTLPGDGSIGDGQPFEGAWDDVGDRQGWIGNNTPTDDTRPEFKGAGLGGNVGDIVVIYNRGRVLGSTTVGADGKWTWTPAAELPLGNYEVSIALRDEAGNESAQTDSLNFQINTGLELPGAPVIDAMFNDESGSAVAITNGHTNDTTPVIRGRGPTGLVVTLYDGDVAVGSVVVTGGAWEIIPSPPLGEGNHVLTAKAANQTGNQGEASAPVNLVVDTIAPTIPGDGSIGPGGPFEGAWDDVGGLTGWVPNAGATDDARPEFKGAGLTGNVGDIVVIYNGATVLGSTTVGAGGTWTWTPDSDLADGNYEVSIALRDKAGNESGKTDSLNFAISTGVALPTAPVISGVFDNDSGAEVAISNGFTKDTTPVIRGTGVNGTVVTLYNGSQIIGSATVTGGVWMIIPAPALEEGVYDLTAKARNALGNEGAASAAVNLTVDVTAPDAPVITRIENDRGDAISGSTTDRDPLFKGTANPAEAGATIELRDAGGNLLGTGTVQTDGSWQVLVSPRLDADQDYNIKAVIIDKAGNRTEMASGVDLSIIPTASILPPVGGIGDIAAVDGGRNVAIGNFNGRLENDKVYTSLGGVHFISTGSDVPVGGFSGTYRSLQFGFGTKTEFHFSGEQELVQVKFNVPAIGESWVSVFDSNGTFIQRFQLESGESNQSFSPPLGGSLGKIVLEVSPDTVGRVSVIEMRVHTLDKVDIVADSSLPDVKSGSEAFDSYATGDIFAANIMHELSSGLKLQSSSVSTITGGGKLQTNLSPSDVLILNVEAANYVEFKAHDRRDITYRILDTNGDVILTLPNIPGATNRIVAPEGKMIGKIMVTFTGSTSINFEIDDIVWGIAPGSGSTPPADIPLPHIAPNTELLMDFNDYGAIGYPGVRTQIDGKRYEAINYSNGLTLLKSIYAGGGSYTGKQYIYSPDDRYNYLLPGDSSDRGNKSTLKFGTGASKISLDIFHLAADLIEQPFQQSYYRIYDIEGNQLVRSGMGNGISYTAPAGVVIGHIEFIGISATIDNVKWTTPPAIISGFNSSDEIESSLLLNDEVVQLAKVGEEQQDAIIGSEGRIDILSVQGEDKLIDLTRLGEMVKSVEVIDLTGSGNNTLNISLGDILVQGDTNLFIHDDTVQMMVKGNAGDVINLSDLVKGSDEGDWAKAEGTVEVAGVKYEVYQHSALDAELLVQEGIQTNLLNN